MTPIRPGARVRVRLPRSPTCSYHAQSLVPVQGETGRVDHIKVDGRRHPIVVVFDAIHVPPFGGRWADSFAADELEIVEP